MLPHEGAATWVLYYVVTVESGELTSLINRSNLMDRFGL